jgi:hypothetical protein
MKTGERRRQGREEDEREEEDKIGLAYLATFRGFNIQMVSSQ